VLEESCKFLIFIEKEKAVHTHRLYFFT